MLLLIHIFIAVVSLAFATYVFLHPVKSKLRITYLFVAFTVISGIVLLMQNPFAALQTCMSGTFYLGIVFVLTSTAKTKLTQTANA